MSVLGDPIGTCKRCKLPLYHKAPFGAMLHPGCDHRAWAAIEFNSPHAARWRKWLATTGANNAAKAVQLAQDILGATVLPPEEHTPLPPPEPKPPDRSALADKPMRSCKICGALTPCRSSATGRYLHPACATSGPAYTPPGTAVRSADIHPPFVGIKWPRVSTGKVWNLLTEVLDSYPGNDPVFIKLPSGTFIDPGIKVASKHGYRLSLETRRVLGIGCTARPVM